MSQYREPRKLNPEEAAQRQVVEYLQLSAPPSLIWYACPNGGHSKGQNGRNKALGVLPGVPDLHFVLDGNRIAYIEMKAPKGVLSEAQKTFKAVCVLRGSPWALCRSVDEVEAALRSWGVPLKATLGRRAA